MRFECDYPDCKRSYLRKEHLSRHQRNHENLRSFSCASCAATFNRSDLLHRHEALNHGQLTRPLSSALADEDGAGITNTLNSPPETLPKVKESAGPTYLDLSGQPPCQLYKDSNRAELQDLYFSKFNTTWPLLDRDDFYNSPQPSSLVDSVLVVGMYMKGTPEAKALAMECHEVLIKSAVHFFTVVLPLVSASCPRVDLLSEFQTLMLPAILALYNVDDGACFLQTFLCNKNIFTLFDQIGVYDQRRIDAEVSSPTHREQYQRLALVHLKLHLHINAIIVTKHAKFKINRCLCPSMVNVRIPILGRTGEEATVGTAQGDPSMLLGSLFADDTPPSSYKNIAAVVAWDFALGMALGCYLVREPDESEVDLIHRMKPFLVLR